MKLKLDENGNVVVQDGKPVYVHDDGKEVPFDAQQALSKISALNGEAKSYRERAEKAENLAKSFDGIDAESAKKALETVKNLDDKKLIDAGEVEKVKAEAKKAFDEQLAIKDKELTQVRTEYHNAVIGGAFARSSVIKDKTILPPDIAQNAFGKHFEMVDGKIVAKLDGNLIYSRINAGETADFEEALETIINQYPHKESILRGSGASGAGAKQGGVSSPSIKRGDMTVQQKADFIKEHGQQAFLNLEK